jgi:hypothetical protein
MANEQSRGPDSTSSMFFAITPHDSNELERWTRAIHVGGAGVVKCRNELGDLVAFTCPAGAVLPVRTNLVASTDTTATLLVGLA